MCTVVYLKNEQRFSAGIASPWTCGNPLIGDPNAGDPIPSATPSSGPAVNARRQPGSGSRILNTSTHKWTSLRFMAVTAVVAASVAACGSSSTQSSTSTTASTSPSTSAMPASPLVATFAAQPSGTVALSWDPHTQNVSAKLQMVGFTPGSSHAMHIHQGSCAAQGDVLVPFPDVTANDVGAIDTTVTSSQPAPDGLAAGTLLNIHLAPAAQLGDPGSLGYTPISCADVDPAATSLNMAPPPQPGQQPQGSAKLTYDPANKTLAVDVTASGLVAGSEHAEHIHVGSCDSQGAVKYPLNDLVASPAGTAEATTVVQNVDQAPPDTGWYLNVHLGSSSQIEENGQPTLYFQPIICGSKLTALQRGR